MDKYKCFLCDRECEVTIKSDDLPTRCLIEGAADWEVTDEDDTL